jgi:hypothetical protein
MANFKKRRPSGRHAGWCRSPHKLCYSPPGWKFRVSELRKLGGRDHRISRRDVDWAFRDEG